MGRPKKGEPKLGKIRQCSGCGKEVYKPPSHSHYKRVICSKECWKKISFSFPCKVCDTPVYTQPTQLKYRARSTCSPTCRRALRKQIAEERHRIFGFTKHQIDRFARYSVEAKEWRKAVFERDNYTCQECGVRGTYLEADHIKPFAYFPELRYTLSNGRTLCRPCHDKTKISYRTLRKIYAKEIAALQEKQAQQAKEGVGILTKADSDKRIRERLLYLRRPQLTRKKLSSGTRPLASKHIVNKLQVRLPFYEDSVHGL